MQTGSTHRTLHRTVYPRVSIVIFATCVGKGVRDQPGFRSLQGVAGGFSTGLGWEPTLPLDRAGDARGGARR